MLYPPGAQDLRGARARPRPGSGGPRRGLPADRRVHAHGLRHTHAYELLAEGAQLDVIQGQLGHASLAVTHRYLAHIAPAERIARVRNRADRTARHNDRARRRESSPLSPLGRRLAAITEE